MIKGLYKIFDHWHKEGTVFIYSDPHFNDPDLKKGIVRPTAEELIQNINSKVGRKDTLIILGDICDIECVKKLRGYKVLIMGNHDSGASNYKRNKWTKIFDRESYPNKEEALEKMKSLYPNCKYIVNEGYSFQAPFTFWKIIADNLLFDEVYAGPLMIGEKLILSHEPLDVPWAFNIHGHIHDSKHKNDKYHFNVCSDVIGHYPINMNQFMKSGALSKIESIHRTTIDKAIARKKHG